MAAFLTPDALAILGISGCALMFAGTFCRSALTAMLGMALSGLFVSGLMLLVQEAL